ncbi:hypothetical protein A9K55_005305 [Cordyceps militaris]|uniref:Uncharacterized protein n=1 Tax=Cordyceps militaris TaxID=73501 RepID=A0A2H4SPA2_CORMI|nr:hypothetical protein A9K55_005305 [Cordyceps militaris]
MCKFLLEVVYCLCNDRHCKHKVKKLGESEHTAPGHVARIDTCQRKARCLQTFTNNKPDRLLVKHGMRPEDGNSKPDCPVARYVLKIIPSKELYPCPKCQADCQWNGSPPPSVSDDSDVSDVFDLQVVADELT